MIDLADLQGRWHVQRRIDDRRAGLVGHFNGTAEWHPDAEGLVQIETGVLTYGQAAPMQATRRYLWRRDGDGLQVFFDDGRPFHRLDARLSDCHDCPPDTYNVSYEMTDWPRWQQIWHVTGPRKDAVIVSTFSRG